MVHGLVQHLGVGLSAHVDFVRRGIDLAKCTDGNQHAAVFVPHAKSTLGFFHDADDQEVRAVYHHVFSNGMPLGKKDRGHVLPKHDHFFLVEIVSFADKPAREGRRIGVNLAEVRLHAAEIDGCHLAGLRAHGVGVIPVGHEKSGYGFHRRALFLDSPGVLDGQRFALAFLKRGRSTVASLVPFGDERCIRAELFNVFLNLLVKAGDQGRDQHDDAYAQHDAEHRERAAQLVGPQGVQSLL